MRRRACAATVASGFAVTTLLTACSGHGGMPAAVLTMCHQSVASKFAIAGEAHFHDETMTRGAESNDGSEIQTYEVSGIVDTASPISSGTISAPFTCTTDPNGVLVDETINGSEA